MFDNLIRRDPRDNGKSIVPDLAHSWEIAKDGQTYTFHLRQGVLFHDTTDFTSAGRESHLRLHLQAATRHQHPAHRAVHRGQVMAIHLSRSLSAPRLELIGKLLGHFECMLTVCFRNASGLVKQSQNGVPRFIELVGTKPRFCKPLQTE